ncbi:MAG TPA: pyridoxal-phosphate dependent enzyme [Anaerolineae bacterium]|nr:pyridoxal-phosphate dependent enzyme [Anaerolineae bacterium]
MSFEDVLRAEERLAGVAHRTPVFTSRTVDELTGYRVFFKAENMQRAGAFKFRGAYNTLSQLSADERKRGVVAYSSGNHAQGVAYAAKLLGIPATVVMPTDAPQSKLAATRGYGANVVFHDRQTEDRAEIAAEIARKTGAVIIPPFDHPHIMAGQGTAGLELMQDVPGLDVLITPVGGGGLLSGCATAAKGINPKIRVFGVETERSNDWWQSVRAGERIKIDPPDTIADGMRTQQPGKLTFQVVQSLVEDILLISEQEVTTAVKFLLMRLKILAEPTGAVAPAAVLSGKLNAPAGAKIGVVISGGNVDAAVLAEILRE